VIVGKIHNSFFFFFFCFFFFYLSEVMIFSFGDMQGGKDIFDESVSFLHKNKGSLLLSIIYFNFSRIYSTYSIYIDALLFSSFFHIIFTTNICLPGKKKKKQPIYASMTLLLVMERRAKKKNVSSKLFNAHQQVWYRNIGYHNMIGFLDM
jgi:hypothetical protein